MIAQEDGKFLLNNGKHWVTALVQVWESKKPDGGLSPEAPKWAEQGFNFLNVELYKALTEGLLVDFVYYDVEAGEERTTQIAVQCYAHEVEQNKFQPSTLANKVAVMARLCRIQQGLVGSEEEDAGHLRPEQNCDRVSMDHAGKRP